MKTTFGIVALVLLTSFLPGCGEAEPHRAGSKTSQDSVPEGARMPTVRMLWPPYLEDVDLERAGPQPGISVQAPDPERGEDEHVCRVRIQVAPGRTEAGSVVEVRSVHFRGPPGYDVAAQEAYVLPAEAGWRAARSADAASYALYAAGDASPLPAEGLTLVLVTTPDVLERAVWRDVSVFLRSDAAPEIPSRPDDAIVGAVYTGGDPATDEVHGYAIRLPYDPDS